MKKKLLVEIFGIFECPLNILNFVDSSKLYIKLLVNPKTGGSRKLSLPENDFKAYSAKLLMPKDPTRL